MFVVVVVVVSVVLAVVTLTRWQLIVTDNIDNIFVFRVENWLLSDALPTTVVISLKLKFCQAKLMCF